MNLGLRATWLEMKSLSCCLFTATLYLWLFRLDADAAGEFKRFGNAIRTGLDLEKL